jgi:phosphate transport system substrate-binding protein
MSKKSVSLMIAFILILGVLAGCGNKNNAGSASDSPSTSPSDNAAATSSPAAGGDLSGKVTASGSTALQPLVQQAAQQFMDTNKGVTVNVTGGGSGTGVKNVADGTSDIGNSDVEAADQYKAQLVDHVVAIAPMALIVNKDVNVTTVTKAQAADIYTGKITNWKDVGGNDLKINLVHRPESSGTRKIVGKVILDGKDFSKEGVTQDSSKAVAEAVATTSGSIGYVDLPYITDKVTALQIDGAAASKETIQSGKYLLFGTEHMYTKGEATGATKAFIEYMMSADFQGKMDKFYPADTLKK